MEIRDFLVTPIYLIVLLIMAYIIRPRVTNARTRVYFFPSLLAKMLGALVLGLIYQFYYGGGDTFGYTIHGGNHIGEAFLDNPMVALKMIFGPAQLDNDTFKYAIKIWYFKDAPTYFVVRVAGFLSILTFNTYSSVAILFACISFSGLWALYNVLQKIYPQLTSWMAFAIFFVPSTVFWGSGVLKDTLTLASLTWAVYALINMTTFRKVNLSNVLILLISMSVIYVIKIYILLCFVPAALFWVFMLNLNKIKSPVLRVMIGPLLISLSLVVSVLGIVSISNTNEKYSVENVLKTAEITAKDNSLWTVRKEGSGYNLGDYDFSPAGMARKFFPAVWVTLFRPYLWEANSAVMLISALESTILLALFIIIIARSGMFNFLRTMLSDPFLIFSLIFTISFAFAIGISSGNFGSLVRYKIPVLPFFVLLLVIIRYKVKANKALIRQKVLGS